MARLIGYLAIAAAAVCACGDGGESAPGAQDSTLEDAAAADVAGRAAPAGGRTPEPGLTAIALSRPEVEPTRSRVMRIDPSAAPCEEVDESPDCPDNSAPVIEPILYEVNGLLFDDLPEVFANDEVLLLVPFRDDDCNLGCGTSDLRFSFEGPRQSGRGAGGGLPLPMDIPCSTAESQTYLGLYPPDGRGRTDPPDPDFLRGALEYSLTLHDACGEAATGTQIAGTIVYQ